MGDRMKSQIPFTDYDFYAYLVPGLVFLVSLYAAAHHVGHGISDAILSDLPGLNTFGVAVLVGVLAYTLGQIFASLSGFALEYWLVEKVWKIHPLDILMSRPVDEPRGSFAMWKGSNYRPLPEPLQRIIRSRLHREFRQGATSQDVAAVPIRGDARIDYELIYATVRYCPDTAARLDASRNQYAFARNMCLATALSAVLFWGAWLWKWPLIVVSDWPFLLALATIPVSLGMWFRFIKFYGIFYQQAFRAYLVSGPAEPRSPRRRAGSLEEELDE